MLGLVIQVGFGWHSGSELGGLGGRYSDSVDELEEDEEEEEEEEEVIEGTGRGGMLGRV